MKLSRSPLNWVSSSLRIFILWFLGVGLAVSLVGPVYIAHALDMNRLQASFRRMGGKPQSFQDWQKLLQDSHDLAVPEKLRRVNDFFNRRIEFVDDQEVWGQSDYWATPMESLAKGRGDCEDYVIAKYFALLDLDIPDPMLRLIYVKARIGGTASAIQQAHMVLAYYATPDAEPVLLDNLINDIRPAARRPDLQPIFSFNAQGVFSGIGAKAAVGPGGVGRLSRWQDLLQRARAEGFD